MNDRLEFLRERAAELPLKPGVYIMKNRADTVIYVGKSRALKNRVSQYFAVSAKHEPKTAKMVSNVYNFEYIITDTEMEALTLENQLIKQYRPKFNIKLKDDKRYPYIKIDRKKDYPKLTVTRQRIADKADYFGPFSGVNTAYEIIRTARRYFGMPDCKRQFPKDIGKERPCIYYQMGQCCGVCTGNVSREEYASVISDVSAFLNGSFSDVKRSLEKKMLEASEELRYEAALHYRDRISELQKLWEKQKVASNPLLERDVFGFFSDGLCSCISLLCIRDGALCDSSHYEFSPEQIFDSSSFISFVADLYSKREHIPKEILLGFDCESADRDTLEEYLCSMSNITIKVKIPERGELRALCLMADENAKQHALIYEHEKEKNDSVLVDLAELLSLEVVPEKIESYDISNFGDDNITAGSICITDGKFDKSGYRLYSIKSTATQDDYASMKEALRRRIGHPENPYPDLILLDGGKGHVNAIKELFAELKVDIPVFGMVKDEYHKTRALTDGENDISIAFEGALFIFIYRIQEEVHRFSITAMKKAKSHKMTSSVLQKIKGIGPKKAQIILSALGSVKAVKSADYNTLREINGISENDIREILRYFKNET